MSIAIIDGITTRYEVVGSGPPLLMYSPGGFNATIETWSTQGVYAKIKPLDHLSKTYTCITFDRRECGQSGGRVERSVISASAERTSWAAAWAVVRSPRSAWRTRRWH
jgi:pimeloyl-ACP methyl ester carboxylesterase